MSVRRRVSEMLCWPPLSPFTPTLPLPPPLGSSGSLALPLLGSGFMS